MRELDDEVCRNDDVRRSKLRRMTVGCKFRMTDVRVGLGENRKIDGDFSPCCVETEDAPKHKVSMRRYIGKL